MHEAGPDSIAPEIIPIENETVAQPVETEPQLLELAPDKLVSLDRVYRDTLADTAVRREIAEVARNESQLLEPEVRVHIDRTRHEPESRDLHVELISQASEHEPATQDLQAGVAERPVVQQPEVQSSRAEIVVPPTDQARPLQDLHVEFVDPPVGHEQSLQDLQVEVVADSQPEPEAFDQQARIFVENEVARSNEEDVTVLAEAFNLEADGYKSTLEDSEVRQSIAEELAQEAHQFQEDEYESVWPTEVDQSSEVAVDLGPMIPVPVEELQEPVILAEAQPLPEALQQFDEALGEVLESAEVVDTVPVDVEIETEVLDEAEFAVIQPELISAELVEDLEKQALEYEAAAMSYEEMDEDIDSLLVETGAEGVDEDEDFVAIIDAIKKDEVPAKSVMTMVDSQIVIQAPQLAKAPLVTAERNEYSTESVAETIENPADVSAEAESKPEEPVTVGEFIYELKSFMVRSVEKVNTHIEPETAVITRAVDQETTTDDEQTETIVEEFKAELDDYQAVAIAGQVIEGLQTLEIPEEIAVAEATINDLMQVAQQVNEFKDQSPDYNEAKEELKEIAKALMEFLGMPRDDDTIKMFINYILEMNKTFLDPGHEIVQDNSSISSQSQKFWQQLPNELWVGYVTLLSVAH